MEWQGSTATSMIDVVRVILHVASAVLLPSDVFAVCAAGCLAGVRTFLRCPCQCHIMSVRWRVHLRTSSVVYSFFLQPCLWGGPCIISTCSQLRLRCWQCRCSVGLRRKGALSISCWCSQVWPSGNQTTVTPPPTLTPSRPPAHKVNSACGYHKGYSSLGTLSHSMGFMSLAWNRTSCAVQAYSLAGNDSCIGAGGSTLSAHFAMQAVRNTAVIS
jgi:hypothetical protein